MNEFFEDLKKYYGPRQGVGKFFVFFYYQGIYASLIYRLLNWLYTKEQVIFKFLYKLLFLGIYVPFKSITGVEIHPEAQIKGGLFIPHCTTIIISKSAVIGRDFTIHQCCTVGVNYTSGKAPVIGEGVFMSCNASIIGDVKIGDNVIILPNSCVVKNSPESYVLGGVPAKAIKKLNN
ncbi:serine O-acetyltransferase [Priestia megaterium]|uniref:serine O-acetyltransferase n=1 Tax=Priestia megaterium TaxID=1404 RepID=UPI00190CA037|nr:serine O-acetyltransferase [Bacillus sp. S35]